MVRSCCICGKKKDKETANSTIRFFRIPSSKSPIFNKWVERIRVLKNKPSERLKKNSIVCSRHFTEDCFLRSKNTLTLKKGSLPTIRDPCNENDTSPVVNSALLDVSDKVKKEPKEEAIEDVPPENNSPVSCKEAAREGSSDSLSPPTLEPFEINSDYEEDVEDPPDLECLNVKNEGGSATYLTSLSEYDSTEYAIQTDHIGSVADILGPDFLPENSAHLESERSEASSKAEVVEVDGQTILSFASAAELEEYVHHCEPSHHQARQIDETIDNTDKPYQPTPSLTPSPCSSPFPSSQIGLPGNSIAAGDANFESSRMSPVQSNSEDSALPVQEVHSIMKADMEEATAFTSEDTATTVLKTLANSSEEGNDSSDALRYSESEDSSLPEPAIKSIDTAVEEDAGLQSSKNPPVLKTDGTITPEVAAFAVSAIVSSPQAEVVLDTEESKRASAASSVDDLTIAAVALNTEESQVVSQRQYSGSGKGKRPGSLSISNRTGRKSEPTMFAKSIPVDETDEMFSAGMVVNETDFEDLIVHEEEYAEDYDIPTEVIFAPAACGNLSCRLGCICESLKEADSRRKQPPDHCPLPECMLGCVCGYKRGKSSGRKTFVSLLKGNEAFYRKINWSSERTRRERKVPERYNEYHLETDTLKQLNTGRGSNSRGNSRPSSPTYKPPTSIQRQFQHRRSQQNQSQQSTSTVPKKKNETFKLKIASDQIKLVRWDSYVPLSKVYVAPDQEIMCMDHNTYNCPCIASSRRIIRIPSKFVPPSVRIGDNQVSPAKPKQNQEQRVQQTSNNSRNVAKKHTHPIMRKVQEKKVLEPDQLSEEGTPKRSAGSKMRKLLQDQRFQLQKLITEEKTRAFDEEIDLTVKLGQTVQLVAWIRFHRIYHAGKMHIRFLSRRSGPVILVMRLTEIMAADITCDIKDMKGKNNAPEIVKELLDPCISPEETSRYAFLLCDGAKWELVGCLSLQVSNPNSSSSAPTPTAQIPTVQAPIVQTPAPDEAAPSSIVEVKNKESGIGVGASSPTIDIPARKITVEESQVIDDLEFIPRAISPAAQRRLDALDEKRRVLEERLEKINTRLNFQPPKPSTTNKFLKPTKHFSLSNSEPNTSSDLNKSSEVRAADPLAPSVHTTGSSAAPRKELSESALVPGMVLIPDFAPLLFNRPTFMTDLSITEGQQDNYFASMQLVQFSKLVLETQQNYIKEITNKSRRLYQAKHPVVESLSPCPSPPPENRRIPEINMLRETSSLDGDDSNMGEPNGYQHIRIVPQQHAIHSTPTTSSNVRPFAQLVHANQNTNGVAPSPAIIKSTGISSSLLIRKLAPNRSSLVSNQLMTGILPTSAFSVLRIPGAASQPGQAAGLPKITSVSSMVAGNTSVQKSHPALMKITGDIEKPIAFPETLSIEVSPVQAPNSGTIPLFNHRMKVVLEAMSGEYEPLCPTRTSMLLPLHSENDEWSLVAFDAVPHTGIPVPGLQVIVPRAVLESALNTAKQRETRVSFPLHVETVPSNSVLKKGFGVYSTHQLPRHAFLGPFPANYLKFKPALPPYMKLLAIAEDPLTAALKSITEEPIVIEVGSPPSISAGLDDSIVIEKVVTSSVQCSEVSVTSETDAISIEPAGTADLSCSEKFNDILSSVEHKSPAGDSIFISAGTESFEAIESSSGLSITKVDTRRENHDSSDSCGLVIVENEKDKENEDIRTLLDNDSNDTTNYVDPSENNWRDDDSRWPESIAYRNGNSLSNSPAPSDELSRGLVIEPVVGGIEKENRSNDGSRKRLIEVTIDDDSSFTRRSPKRTRRPTEKARMFAEELKANRSSSASSSQSSQADQRHQPSPSNLTKRNSFQRELHIIKEQERRGLLGKLFRDLDSMIAPNSGPRSKIVILKHATNTANALKEQSRELDNLYGLLKTRRHTLLQHRSKLFNDLPADVKPVFNRLMDSTPIPEEHLKIAKLAPNENFDNQADRSQHELQDDEDSEEIDVIFC